MSSDVLIIDDIRSALDSYGNQVRIDLEIEPFLADDPYQALTILKYYPIKVLVTDQNMPKMTGIELVKKAKNELNLNIPCIMLTAYTDDVSVVEAVNAGFFRFIDKRNTHLELIPSIKQALHNYEINALQNSLINVNKVISSKKNLKLISNVNLKLLRVSSIVENYIRENDWHTEYTAQRNASSSYKLKISHEASYYMESGMSTELMSDFDIKTKKLVVELKTILQNRVSFIEKTSYEEKLKIEAEYKLEIKEITDHPTAEGLILQSRQYQTAPVYTRVNCLFQIDCTYCGIPKNFNVSIDIPTKKIALRQVEYFNKGQPKKIYTGFVTGSIKEPIK